MEVRNDGETDASNVYPGRIGTRWEDDTGSVVFALRTGNRGR